MTDPIPQTDPRASYLAQRAEIDAAMARAMERGQYILGPEVTAFEQEFAAFVGNEIGIGAASGTDAIHLALRAIGIGEGDYVATVSHTAVATVAAIEMAGAKPLLIDIEPATYTMDAAELKRALAKPPGRVGAILPVHLYGQACDMGAIMALARDANIPVVEDCAQCHGASYAGKKLGSFGVAAAWSFYPTKNLGAFGDAGMVTTSDESVAQRVRELRQYGWRQRYVSATHGINSRLDDLQAAILRVKLIRLPEADRRRQAIAAHYDTGLAAAGLSLPVRRVDTDHVFHQYVVRLTRRDSLRQTLTEQGIGTGIHYPVPVHLQPAYAGRVASGPAGLGESERAAREVLSLPMYPELSVEHVTRIIAALTRANR